MFWGEGYVIYTHDYARIFYSVSGKKDHHSSDSLISLAKKKSPVVKFGFDIEDPVSFAFLSDVLGTIVLNDLPILFSN